MMISLVAAALVNAAAQAPASADQLPSLFVSACIDGSVRIRPGDATPIQFGELPTALRSRLGNPSSSKVWKLRSAGRSYLYLLDFQGQAAASKICGVAGEDLALTASTSAIDARLSGRLPIASSSQSTEWVKPADGYKALATRTGGFTVLQVNWLKANE